MTIIYGGSENGLLNSSFALIGRGDQAGPGDPGHGERVYVNSVNGNLVIQHQDAYLPSFGADFQLVRTYNQRGLPIDPAMDGKRWSLSTSIFLSELHDGPERYYEVQYGDGSTFEYRRDAATGLYISPDGADSFETIEDLGVNGNTAPAFLLTRADQTVLAFNRHGDLISSVDPNGVRMDYFYQSNRLMTIKDDTGHEINFIYQMGMLKRVEDELGTVLVQYAYQGQKLIEVVDRFGHSTKYHYSPQGELIRIELPYEQTVDGVDEVYARREIQLSYESINWADSNQSGGATAGNNYVVSQIIDAQGGITTFEYEFNLVDPQDPPPGPGNNGNGKGPFGNGPPSFVDAVGNQMGGNSGNGVGGGPATPGGRHQRFNINGDPFTGGRTTVTDAAGHTLVYEYDGDGQVTRVTDRLGYATEYVYDEQGNLTAIRDRNAWGVTNSDHPHYRALRAALGVTDLTGSGKLVADLDQAEIDLLVAAFTTTMTYDDRGNLLTTTDNDGFVTTYTYTDFNKIDTMLSGVGYAMVNSDAQYYQDKRVELGFAATVAGLDQVSRDLLLALYTTEYEYDANQNLIERRDPGGDITRFEYDANGNRTRQIVFLDASDLTDPAKQQVTQYFYDGFGNNIETIDPELNHTFGLYDHFGNLIQYTDANGNITNYVYDEDNRLLSVRDPLGHTTVNTYDAVGNRTSITDQNGHTTIRIYSQNNLLLSILDPSDVNVALDRETTFVYDVVGNRTSTTDAEGRETTYTYNERRELVQVLTTVVADENGADTQYATDYSYDGEGNRLSIRDRRGNLTEMLYTQGGLLEQRTDTIGQVTQYRYDANNNQIQIIVGAQLPLARQQIVSFSFDEEDQLVTRTDAESNVRVFAHDAAGNVVAITDENGNTTDYEFDRNNRLVREIAPEVYDPVTGTMVRHEVVREYDGNGNQVKVTDARGNSTHFTFDADNRLVMVTDGNGIKTVYGYDSRDNRTSILIGATTTDVIDGQFTVTNVDNAQITRYQYDEFNQLVARVDGVGNALAESDLLFYRLLRGELLNLPAGTEVLVSELTQAQIDAFRNDYTETYSYDRVGNNLSVTDNEDRTTVKQYDALDRLIKELLPQVSDPFGVVQPQTSIERFYDGNGNLVSLIDQLGRESRFDYDAANRLTSSFDNLGVETAREYDTFGNLTFLTRAANAAQLPGAPIDPRTTEYRYDLNNRLTDEFDPLGHHTISRYDAVGNRIEFERVQAGGDPLQVTHYAYDALNRNISILDPRSFETRFEYDGAGNRVNIVDARSGVRNFEYDAGNRQIRLTDAEGRVMEFAYDVRGNRIEVRTAVGTPQQQQTVFAYDAQNNLRSVVDDENGTTTYDFDRVYNRTRVVDANGNATTIEFDALNRAIRVTDAMDFTTVTTYNAVNNVVSRIDELGRETTFTYDLVNRLLTETSPVAYGQTPELVETHYQYDAVGNRISITRAANIAGEASTIQFFYDLDDKLIKEIDGAGGVTTYEYDVNHNVIGVTDPNGHALVTSNDATYQAMRLALNELAPPGLVFEADVALLSDADKAALLELRTTHYEYNQNNQLTKIIDPLDYEVSYDYDGNGNRTVVTDQRGNQSVTYYNANNEVRLSVDAEGYATRVEYDANGNVSSRTLFATALTLPLDANTEPTPVADALRDQTTSFDYDGLNRVIARTSGEGYRTEFSYDAVGNRTEVRLFRNLNDVTDVAITRSYYDELNREIFTQSAEGYLVKRDFSAVGNLVEQTVFDDRVAVPAAGALPDDTGSGRTEKFTYDAADRLVLRESALGALVSFAYDARGNQLTRTDEATVDLAARTTTFRYDLNDRRYEEEDAAGTITRFEFDAVGNVITRYEAFGEPANVQRDFHFQYDGNNRRTSQINAIGVETRFQYDGAGNLVARTDGINALGLTGERTELFAYDDNNRLIQVTNGEGEIVQIGYDAAGNEILLTEAPGFTEMRVTGSTYDRDNRLVEATDANGVITRYTYDGAGNQLTVTEAFGIVDVERTTQFQYDKDNRLIFEFSALGHMRELRYDALGRPTSSFDRNGNETVSTYDKEGRLLTITSPEGIRLTNVYDVRGNLLSSTQAFVTAVPGLGLDARESTYEYDVLGQLTHITNGEGYTTRFTYDLFGNQTKIEVGLDLLNPGMASPLVDTFTYDKADRMLSTADANGTLTEFGYDAVGNRIRTTAWAHGNVADQRTTINVFDLANREIEVLGAGGGIVRKIYDEVGNLTRKETLQSRDPNDLSLDVWIIERFEFDGLGRQIASIDGMGVRNEVVFDAVGNVTALREAVVAGVAETVAYLEYDLDNRQIGQVDALGNRTIYGYDAAGNRTSVTDAMGNIGYYYFDRNNRQIAILDPEGYVNTFKYDAANNLVETRSYATVYVTNDPTVLPTPAIDLIRDKTITSVFDRDNNVMSLTNADGTLSLFEHDSTGKLRTQIDNANAIEPRIRTFDYDAGGRLQMFTDVDGTVTTFAYDGANNKISETLVSADPLEDVRHTTFMYDKGNRVIMQTFVNPGFADIVQETSYDRVGNIVEKMDANGKLTRTRYDLNNRFIEIIDQLNNSVVIQYDARGNQTMYTDPNGRTIEFVYDENNRVIQQIQPEVMIYEFGMAGPVAHRPTIVTVYDDIGNAIQTIDANGNRTTRYFDANRNVVAEVREIADDRHILREFTYNATGQVLTETLYMISVDATAHTTRPDAPGGLDDRVIITRTYDLMGRLRTESYSAIGVSSLNLTGGGGEANPELMTDGDATVTRTKIYDAYGNEVENIDFNGKSEFFYYDAQGRVVASVNSLGYLTEFTYDTQGNVVRRRNFTMALDIANVSWTTRPVPTAMMLQTSLLSEFKYDAAGRNISELTPSVSNYRDGGVDTAIVEQLRTDYTFDAAGNQLTRTRAAGTSDFQIEYSYFDAANRLVAVIDENRTLHTYTRDANGNITSQRRWLNTVSTMVNLANLSGTGTNWAQLVNENDGDQETENVYDKLGRLTSTTDLMGPMPTDDLTVRRRYDANGNITWRQDEDDYISVRMYDGENRVVRTISPDGSGSEVVYDAMGNDVRLYTGDVLYSVREATVGNVALEFVDGEFRVAWTVQTAAPLPDLPEPPDVESWIVWDVDAQHDDIDDYQYKSPVQNTSADPAGSYNLFDHPGFANLQPDQEVFFRIVSNDPGRNKAWTTEYRVLVPPKFTDLTVSQPTDDTMTVSVRFVGTVSAPVLNFGTQPNADQSTALVLQGDGSYAATISVTDAQTLVYQVGWQDALGNSFTSTTVPFEADTVRAGITSAVTNMSGNRIDITSRLTPAIAQQFRSEAADAPVLEMEYRVAGSSDAYDVAPTAIGMLVGGYYEFDFSATGNIASGDYKVVLFGRLSSGQRYVLDTFVTTSGDNGAVHEAMAWALPQSAALIGADQLVILDGLRADGIASRSADGNNLLIDLDDSAAANRAYDVFYGNLMTGPGHAINVNQYYVTVPIADATTADDRDPLTNPNGPDTDPGNDYQVDRYELEVTASNTPPGTMVAWREANTGAEFANEVPLGSRFTIPTPGDESREFDIKVFHTDANGNEVIVSWHRVATANGTPAIGDQFIVDPDPGDKDELILSDTSQSLTVLASETGATINRNPDNVPTLDRGLYVGALIAEDRYRTYNLNFTETTNLGSSEDFNPGDEDGFFVDNRFDTRGNRIATNEGDGVWREFALDANGNTIATLSFASEAEAIAWHADMQNGPQPIMTFAEFDAANREIRTWGALVTDADSTQARRAIDRTTYDFANRVLSRTDSRGFTESIKYDALGRIERETNKLGDYTDYRYDRYSNRVAQIKDPTNPNPAMRRITVWAYDGIDRMTSETNPLGFTTTFELDAFGRRVRETGEGDIGTTQDDRVRTIEYDQRDRVVKTTAFGNTAADNRITEFKYDGRNNRLETRDANGHFWRQEYDAMGRVSATISFQAGFPVIESRTYDYFGNLIATTDAEGRTRTNEYGKFSRLLSSTDESGRRTVFGYDAYGRQSSETESSSGKNILRSFDDAGRLVSIVDSGTGITTLYTYDIAGNRRTESTTTDPTNVGGVQSVVYLIAGGTHNRNVSYTYDALGQVTRWADSVTNTRLNYMYDAFGNLKRSYTDENIGYTLPGGGVVNNTYNYDMADRVTSINRGGTLLTYSYNEFNDRTQYFDGTITYNYAYDKFGQVAQATYSVTDDQMVTSNFRLNWVYDKVGNVVLFTDVLLGAGTDPDVVRVSRFKVYWENNRNFLTSEQRNDADEGTTTQLIFDRTGRLRYEFLTQTSDGGDESKSFTYTHTYADDGRELSITATGDGTGATSFQYNSNDQTAIVNQGTGDDLEGSAFKIFVHNNENRIIFRYIEDGEEDTPQPQLTDYLYALGKPVGDIDTVTSTDDVTTTTTTIDSGAYNLVQDIGQDFPSSAVTRITASEGDTAQSIAAAVYGNPSLWFIIAEANGLSGNEVLTEGQQILVPNTVQTGTLTSSTNVVYNEGDIIGSTLPNITSPPPDSTAQCLAILAIILVIIVAIVVTIVTFGVGSAVAAPAAAAATASIGAVLGSIGVAAATAASVAAVAGTIAAALLLGVIGAAIAFVGAVITQGILIGLTAQKKFDWLSVASAVAGGFLAGAASGLGALVSAGRIVGTVAIRVARVAQVALDTGAEVVSQLIADPPGEISSWASIAGAAVGSGIGVLGDTLGAAAKNADDVAKAAAQQADAAADFASAITDVDVRAATLAAFTANADTAAAAATAAKKSVARATTLSAAANVATVWVGLAEQSQKRDEEGNLIGLSPTDFISAAGLTLGIAVNRVLSLDSVDAGGRIANRIKNSQRATRKFNSIVDGPKVSAAIKKDAFTGAIDDASGALFGVGFLGNTPGGDLTVAVQGFVGILTDPFVPKDLPRITPDTGPTPAPTSPTAAFAGPVATTPVSDPLADLLVSVAPPPPAAPGSSTNPSTPPAASSVSGLGAAINSGSIQAQLTAIAQINTAPDPGPQIGPAVASGNGATPGPLSNTNGLTSSTIPLAASVNTTSDQQGIANAQQAAFGGAPPMTPAAAGAAPGGGLNGAGPLPQVNPVAFSNALVSQAEASSSIADHVNSIAMTGNGIRSNDVFGDPGAATTNDRVLGSLGTNGKLGVPLPPRQPDDAQTTTLATPGVYAGVNPYSASAPVSAAGAFALGAVSSSAAGAALGLASGMTTDAQYAGELSEIASLNQVSTPEGASGVSLLTAAAGTGMFGPPSAVAAGARGLALGNAVPWAFGRFVNANAQQGFGERYNYLAGAGDGG